LDAATRNGITRQNNRFCKAIHPNEEGTKHLSAIYEFTIGSHLMGFRQSGPGQPPEGGQTERNDQGQSQTQTEAEKEAERRKLRRLQLMIDMVLSVLSQDPDLTRAEAADMVANCKAAALAMFPDKELAFELIYRPRLERVVNERFRLQ
jgi:hypothetical protein